MKSYLHFISSLAIGATAFLILEISPLEGFLVLGSAVFFGTLIDLDHFLLARYEEGDWKKLEKALKNPLKTFTADEELLGDEWLEPINLLKIHMLEFTSLLGIILLLEGNVYLKVGVVSLGAHLLMDLYQDYREGKTEVVFNG